MLLNRCKRTESLCLAKLDDFAMREMGVGNEARALAEFIEVGYSRNYFMLTQ
jgi:hypothetical protein